MSIYQPEASFNLVYTVQVINPDKKYIKLLNKRIQWQIVRDIIAVTLGSPQGSPQTPLGWLLVTCRRHMPVVYSLHDPRGLISLKICLFY